MRGLCWTKVSHLARDLVSKLLVIDQEKRLSAEQILSHQWFQGDTVVVDRVGVGGSEADIGSMKMSVSRRGEERGIGWRNKGRRKEEDWLRGRALLRSLYALQLAVLLASK